MDLKMLFLPFSSAAFESAQDILVNVFGTVFVTCGESAQSALAWHHFAAALESLCTDQMISLKSYVVQ